MTNKTDIARLYVLLSSIKSITTYRVEKNIHYLCKLFPNWTEEDICRESQKLINRLADTDLQKKYGDVFRSLSIDQRYSACIEVPVYFHRNGNIFSAWFEAYSTAKQNWFTSEEVLEVRSRIKNTIDRMRQQAKAQLAGIHPEWIDWELAKNELYIVDSYAEVSNDKNLLYKSTTQMYAHHYIVLRTNDGNQMHYVTHEDACLWGKHSEIIWAVAAYNGFYTRGQDETVHPSLHSNGKLMPTSFRGIPESQWEDQIYRYQPELKKWTLFMLGHCNDHECDNQANANATAPATNTVDPRVDTNPETQIIHDNVEAQATTSFIRNKPALNKCNTEFSPLPVEDAIKTDTTTQLDQSNRGSTRSLKVPAKRVKNPLTLSFTIADEWKIIIDSTAHMFRTGSIISQEGSEYPLSGTSRTKKATARKNLKSCSPHFQRIEGLLVDYSEALHATTCIDTAYDMVCYISHEIDSLRACHDLLQTEYGYVYEANPSIQEIKDACFAYYVSLLVEKATSELKTKSKLVVASKKKSQLLLNASKKIEQLNVTIIHLHSQLAEQEQNHRDAQKELTVQNSNHATEAARLEATLSALSAQIAETQKSIISSESSLAAITEEKRQSQAHHDATHSKYSALIAANNQESADLQSQIAEAEAVLKRTILFKKAKQQRVDALRSSLGAQEASYKHQREDLEKELATLSQTCSTLSHKSTQLIAAIASANTTLEQLKAEHSYLNQQLANNQNELQRYEDIVTALASDIAKNREELHTAEQRLEEAKTEHDQISTELNQLNAKITDQDATAMQHVLIYPKGFDHTRPSTKTIAASDFAFTRQLSDFHAHGQDSNAEAAKLANQHLHLSALFQAMLQLKRDDLLNSNECFDIITEKLSTLEERIPVLHTEATVYSAPFLATVDPGSPEGSVLALTKKAKRLLDTFWSSVSEGIQLPKGMSPAMEHTYVLHVTSDYSLYFTPFYVIGMQSKKNKPVTIDLLRYSDISFELDDLQIPLGYGKECPNGATVVAEHWKYETINGMPNRRYTNNPSYLIVALNTVQLRCAANARHFHFTSMEDAKKAVHAFRELKNFLHNDNADLIAQLFECCEIPSIASIATEIVEKREREESDRKEQERRLKQQELLRIKQREEEKRQKEQHQKRLELWAESAQKSREEDERLVSQRLALLPSISADQILGWDVQTPQPVIVTDKRRTITNGITKVEFLQHAEAVAGAQYLVSFSDCNGKAYSDIRTLPSKPIGATTIIPFEIKTQSIDNPSKLYLLIRNMEDGQLVGMVEYKLNIAFTNDFDF